MNLPRHTQALQQASVLCFGRFVPFIVFSFSSSQHLLKPLFKARLPERAHRLQHRFSHRVPELLEEHPEKKHEEKQEPKEHPHVQAQVPAPAESQGQRGGRHQKFSGGRHGVRKQPRPFWSSSSRNALGSSSGLRGTLCCCYRSHCSSRYPSGLVML